MEKFLIGIISCNAVSLLCIAGSIIIMKISKEKKMEKRTKKDEYNESLFDKRTYINGETAMKPYYYYRNGTLHVRYNVDRCIELSETESEALKKQMSENPVDKQGVLENAWSFFSMTVGKPVIHDGIQYLENKIKELKGGHKN